MGSYNLSKIYEILGGTNLRDYQLEHRQETIKIRLSKEKQED